MVEKDSSADTPPRMPSVQDPNFLDQVVRTIVEAVHPDRIILFGSVARAQQGPHSDLDLLIVMPDGVHRRQVARQIYRELRDMDFAKDVVVVTQEDVRRFKDNPSLVIMPALNEGKELYRAAG